MIDTSLVANRRFQPNQKAGEAASFQVPAGVKTKPWLHQIEAFNFAMQQLRHGGGAALLALEMGVGKTLVALMILLALAAKRTLIVCPLRVIAVWERQIQQHLDLPLIVVALSDSAGSVANKKTMAEESKRPTNPS